VDKIFALSMPLTKDPTHDQPAPKATYLSYGRIKCLVKAKSIFFHVSLLHIKPTQMTKLLKQNNKTKPTLYLI
jgi:hypothetical protein